MENMPIGLIWLLAIIGVFFSLQRDYVLVLEDQ